MEPIRETLARRKLDPASKMIDILEEIEADEAVMKDSLEGEPLLAEFLLKGRQLKHKLLKDLMAAKQTEDDLILKMEAQNQEKRFRGGAMIPLIREKDRMQLADGRWVIGRKEGT